MREGKVEAGCEQLEQSQAIEVGIGTMMYLAECYEWLGRTASAWALFREAESAAREEGQPDRMQQANARAALLEPKLSKLTVSVPPSNSVPGLLVEVNGVRLAQGAWGVPVPVDPGDSRIAARAPGYRDWIVTQAVMPGAAATAVIPALMHDEVSAPTSTLSAASAAATMQPTAASASHVDRDAGWPVQRTVSIVVGAAGVVALGVGTYFGLRAISKDNDADALCMSDSGGCSNSQGSKLADEAKHAATLSNVFVFGGAALVATGVILYVTAPDANAPALALNGDSRGARLTLGGVF
jgi:serine/threonine-protein kinase